MIKDKEWLKNEIINLKGFRLSPMTTKTLDEDKVIALVNMLDEPELPVIPKLVADWYEEHKDNIYYHVSKKIQSAENNNDKSMCLELIEFWLMDFENENIGKILKMKDGYTIEQPKTYRFTLNAFHEIDVNATSLEEAQKEAEKTWNQYFVRNRDFGEAEFEGEVNEEGELAE